MNEFMFKKDGVMFSARKNEEDGDVYITFGTAIENSGETIIEATDAILIGLALMQIGESEK